MNAAPARRVEHPRTPRWSALLRRPGRARPHVRLRGRLAHPGQHHLRVRARRRGARARRQGRHAREPVADRRRDPRLDGEGLPDAARAAAAGRVPRPLARVRRGPRPRGARHAGRAARDGDLQGRLDGGRERPLRGQGRQRDPPARGVQRLGLPDRRRGRPTSSRRAASRTSRSTRPGRRTSTRA